MVTECYVGNIYAKILIDFTKLPHHNLFNSKNQSSMIFLNRNIGESKIWTLLCDLNNVYLKMKCVPQNVPHFS